jgi:hypothetical protein
MFTGGAPTFGMLQLEVTLPIDLALRECKFKTRVELLKPADFPCEIIADVRVSICLELSVLLCPYELTTKMR